MHFTCWREIAPSTGRKCGQLQPRPGRASPGTKQTQRLVTSKVLFTAQSLQPSIKSDILTFDFVSLSNYFWTPNNAEGTNRTCCDSHAVPLMRMRIRANERWTSAVEAHLDLDGFVSSSLWWCTESKCGKLYQWMWLYDHQRFRMKRVVLNNVANG